MRTVVGRTAAQGAGREAEALEQSACSSAEARRAAQTGAQAAKTAGSGSGVAKRAPRPRGSPFLVLEGEADLDGDLPVIDLVALDVPAAVGDLEPAHAADRLGGLGQGAAHRVVAR